MLTENLNTVRTRTGMKQNLLHCFFLVKNFVSFVKLLNINQDEFSLFLSHLKPIFYASFRSHIILCDYKYPAAQVRFKEGLKLA